MQNLRSICIFCYNSTRNHLRDMKFRYERYHFVLKGWRKHSCAKMNTMRIIWNQTKIGFIELTLLLYMIVCPRGRTTSRCFLVWYGSSSYSVRINLNTIKLFSPKEISIWFLKNYDADPNSTLFNVKLNRNSKQRILFLQYNV